MVNGGAVLGGCERGGEDGLRCGAAGAFGRRFLPSCPSSSLGMPLFPKLQLRTPCARRGKGVLRLYTRSWSFSDRCVPKLELGHEERLGFGLPSFPSSGLGMPVFTKLQLRTRWCARRGEGRPASILGKLELLRQVRAQAGAWARGGLGVIRRNCLACPSLVPKLQLGNAPAPEAPASYPSVTRPVGDRASCFHIREAGASRPSACPSWSLDTRSSWQ
jgi:hypothetical protein